MDSSRALAKKEEKKFNSIPFFAAYARPRSSFERLLENENVISRHYVQRHYGEGNACACVREHQPSHPPPPTQSLNWDLKNEEEIFSLSLFFLRLPLAHHHRPTRLLFSIQHFYERERGRKASDTRSDNAGERKTRTHTGTRPTHPPDQLPADFRRLPQHFPVASAIPKGRKKKSRLDVLVATHYFLAS